MSSSNRYIETRTLYLYSLGQLSMFERYWSFNLLERTVRQPYPDEKPVAFIHQKNIEGSLKRLSAVLVLFCVCPLLVLSDVKQLLNSTVKASVRKNNPPLRIALMYAIFIGQWSPG